jgi:2-C-methyl-D-erythritol 2,4-cyclodiphosphate synthase
MYRTGIGYDVHPFQEGRPLVLGGIAIPHSRGLKGHSDADVLAHAIADAVLEGKANAGQDAAQAVAAGSDEFVEVSEDA